MIQSARDWIFQVDLYTALHFPAEVDVISLRLDIVVWSKATKTVLLCELKVPWEDHAKKAYERKQESQYPYDTAENMFSFFINAT